MLINLFLLFEIIKCYEICFWSFGCFFNLKAYYTNRLFQFTHNQNLKPVCSRKVWLNKYILMMEFPRKRYFENFVSVCQTCLWENARHVWFFFSRHFFIRMAHLIGLIIKRSIGLKLSHFYGFCFNCHVQNMMDHKRFLLMKIHF